MPECKRCGLSGEHKTEAECILALKEQAQSFEARAREWDVNYHRVEREKFAALVQAGASKKALEALFKEAPPYSLGSPLMAQVREALDLKPTDAERHVVEARRLMESIMIRCQEGDPKSDWLPIINNLALKAVHHLYGSDGP